MHLLQLDSIWSQHLDCKTSNMTTHSHETRPKQTLANRGPGQLVSGHTCFGEDLVCGLSGSGPEPRHEKRLPMATLLNSLDKQH